MIGLRLSTILPAMLLLFASAPAGPALADPRPPDANLTVACALVGACPERLVPGPADRDVHPFAGRLGRPCGWRERPTPQGPRRVRACF